MQWIQSIRCMGGPSGVAFNKILSWQAEILGFGMGVKMSIQSRYSLSLPAQIHQHQMIVATTFLAGIDGSAATNGQIMPMH